MDLDEFRLILSNSRLDVWGIIDAAITVASIDYSCELKHRRDGIVERLYAIQQCSNCDLNVVPQEHPNDAVQSTLQDNDDEAEWLYENEQTKVNRIKEQLEDPHQTEDAVVELLQTLADMDLTFKSLKESDIGRNVNRLRKHSSNEVRSLVKHLVRKWKELVDDWVGSNRNDHQHYSPTDGDSPLLQRKAQSSNQEAPDFGYSPNPHNWNPAHERINPEQEQRSKGVVLKRETPSRPASQPHPVMTASAPRNQPHKEQNIDPERLASATKRLQENYQEAQNAKKQRTIQVMDIHEIPKPKNGFIAKNKGNFQGRHHR